MDRLAVIIPDESSGLNFLRTLEDNYIPSTAILAKIAPRVISDNNRKHRLTPNRGKVSLDLANSIYEAISLGHTQITIACNTLCLDVFVQPALNILSVMGLAHGVDFTITTTLKALAVIYRDPEDIHTPIFLGTTPICTILNKSRFRTLINMDTSLQSLTQEVIWRTKAVHNMDHSTAKGYSPRLKNKNAYHQTLKLFFKKINALEGDEEVILGCTELPVAVVDAQKLGVKITKKLINPADILAQAIRANRIALNPGYTNGNITIRKDALGI